MNAINVEVIIKNASTLTENQVVDICKQYLIKNGVLPGSIISKFNDSEVVLDEEVEHIIVEKKADCEIPVDYRSIDVNWYAYRLDRNGPQSETCESESGDEVYLATHWVLPSADLFTLWENLIYENDIKENLLNYAYTMMEFSDKGVNSNIISCNRVILLHGPPGTGKTSLCKALAQKLCIKMRKRYKQSILIEINSHSLFSKWFSESGKLVTKMFNKIREIVEVPSTLVCVLIDEIESLAHARDQCLSGNEPSDAIKVVNAVLTQIDQIKRYPNVIILTTSNMTAAIDLAFIDRADIKQYIGPPSIGAINEIYYSCLHELMKVNVITDEIGLKDEMKFLEKLTTVSKESVGMSGRMLRKIPFLAHALFLNNRAVSFNEFLEAMRKAIVYENAQRKHFSTPNLANGYN